MNTTSLDRPFYFWINWIFILRSESIGGRKDKEDDDFKTQRFGEVCIYFHDFAKVVDMAQLPPKRTPYTVVPPF